MIRTVAVSDCDRSLLRGGRADLRLVRYGEMGRAVRDQTMQLFNLSSGGHTLGGC